MLWCHINFLSLHCIVNEMSLFHIFNPFFTLQVHLILVAQVNIENPKKIHIKCAQTFVKCQLKVHKAFNGKDSPSPSNS